MKVCKEYETRISALIDNELTPADRLEVMEHLAMCPACKAYWEELLTMGDILRGEETSAPHGFAETVMQRVHETGQERKVVTFSVWKSVAAIAACCAIAVLGVWTMGGTGMNNMTGSALSSSGAPESFALMDNALPGAPEAPEDTATCDAEPRNSAEADDSASYGAWNNGTCVLSTASEVAEEWVEENLGENWVAGACYALSEEQYKELRRALQEAEEPFNEIMGNEESSSYQLLAE